MKRQRPYRSDENRPFGENPYEVHGAPQPPVYGRYPQPDNMPDAVGQSVRFNRALRSKRNEGGYRRSYWYTWIIALSIAILMAILVPTFIFSVEPVDGDSMSPTLHTGEQLLIDKLSYSLRTPRRFEVVICRYPGRKGLFVKRVIGLPGETIEIDNGRIYIDEYALDDASFSIFPDSGDMPPFRIPQGHVFVMGDNRGMSTDSRDTKVGPIPYRMLVGRSNVVLLPFSQLRIFR